MTIGSALFEVDVLEPEVAVPVPDPLLLDPRPEAAGFPLQDPELPAPHGVERVARDEPAHERLHLGEVLGDVVTDHLDRARLGRRGGVGEEAREPRRQAREVLGRERAPAQEGLRALLVREPPHADGIVDDVSVGTEPVALPVEPDRDDPEVDIRREPPVQPDLVLAAAAAPRERRVVDEPVVDGALELPDVPVREEHPGDVCRDLRDLRGSRDRVGLRAPKVFEERPGRHLLRHRVAPPREPSPAPWVGPGNKACWTASRNAALEKGLAR